MRIKNVIFETKMPEVKKDDFVFNLVFSDTGEIRQKRRSKEWVMRRIFFHELRTWEKRHSEKIVYEDTPDV